MDPNIKIDNGKIITIPDSCISDFDKVLLLKLP